MITSFEQYVNKLSAIKDWDSFVLFFNNEPTPIKILVSAIIFGCLTLVYIFFVAMFSDKHN